MHISNIFQNGAEVSAKICYSTLFMKERSAFILLFLLAAIHVPFQR